MSRRFVFAFSWMCAGLALACGGSIDSEPAGGAMGSAGQAIGASGGAAAGGPTRPHVTDEVLVLWKRGTVAGSKAKVRGKLSATHGETIHTPRMKAAGAGELEVMKLPPGLSVGNAVAALEGLSDVDVVEPNWEYAHAAGTQDPLLADGTLWGMKGDATPADDAAPVYGSRAEAAWARGNEGSSSIYVGIIDEGYMHSHPDLAENAGTNPGEIPGNGRDDDGNGYVDDVHGWDFVKNDATVFDGAFDDHGTHVAGTIGAVGNGVGVVGMAPNVKLLSGKFLGKASGTTANAIKAIDYFTDLKLRHGLNIVATNNSWGGGGYSRALRDAIERANAADILFVAAAMNEARDLDATAGYPAGYDNANIIAVGALTKTGEVASFSNWGARTVDLFAPGKDIWSTIPTNTTKGRATTNGYASYNGTSMAAPHVTGAAVLFAATHPDANAAAIKAAILTHAIPTASLAGKCATGARLNVAAF